MEKFHTELNFSFLIYLHSSLHSPSTVIKIVRRTLNDFPIFHFNSQSSETWKHRDENSWNFSQLISDDERSFSHPHTFSISCRRRLSDIEKVGKSFACCWFRRTFLPTFHPPPRQPYSTTSAQALCCCDLMNLANDTMRRDEALEFEMDWHVTDFRRPHCSLWFVQICSLYSALSTWEVSGIDEMRWSREETTWAEWEWQILER